MRNIEPLVEEESVNSQDPAEGMESWIAVIGMAGRFPEAPDIETFWQNLCAEKESVTFFSRETLLASGVPESLLDDPQFVPARAYLADAECFDAGFFQISPREAELLDPQQRLFLECAWASLEDAAYDPQTFAGSIGVFAGCSANTYLVNNLLSNPAQLESLGGIQAVLSTDKDHLSTRASYKLGLTGPSITLQTACSTSLVAIQQACWNLLTYQCDMALAGGSSVNVPMYGGHRYQDGSIFWPDGHCRAFDARAAGTVSGDGVGVVVLRRYEDAIADGDAIRAIIRGAAINNDGAQKIGYTAPSIQGQAEVIASAHAMADVEPESISYIEAHGTATALGDPVELAALTQAFRTQTTANQFCALGSVKTNIGHLNAAAGVAGLIKTVMALEHKTIPASLHYKISNPAIEFEETPFFIQEHTQAWPNGTHPRRAGVSSFGAGGTNAHVILEEAPPYNPTPFDENAEEPVCLMMSAQTQEGLQKATQQLSRHLQAHPELSLADVAWTLREGRRHFSHRCATLASSTAEAIANLNKTPNAAVEIPRWQGMSSQERTRPIAFLFPSQGAQRTDMGRKLYETEPAFRQLFDSCCDEANKQLGIDLRTLIFSSSPETSSNSQTPLENQLYAGPALFCLGYALAQWWHAHGIHPSVVYGHSTGEYIAAAVAGIMDWKDALSLLITRAKLMATIPEGTGLLVPLSVADLQPKLHEDTWLALINGPQAVVVTGTVPAIERLEADLKSQQIPTRRVRISCPAHSPLMQPIAEPLQQAAAAITLQAPKIPVISGVTGTWLREEEALDPAYWVRHLLQTVEFAKVMQLFDTKGEFVLLEAGPVRSASTLVAYNLPDRTVISGDQPLLSTMAQLWTEGALSAQHEAFQSPGQRIHLPTYPFAKTRYWISPTPHAIPTLAHLGYDGERRAIQASSPSGNPMFAAHSMATNGQSHPSIPPMERHPRRIATPYRAPRNPAEYALSTICEEIFNIAPISIDDNFIALGADSLITLRLIREIERRMGIKLPPAAAFTEWTIERIAPFLQEAMLTAPTTGFSATTATHESSAPSEAHDTTLQSCLIPVRTTGSLPPLFLMHSAAGVVFPYFPLIHELDPELPIYLLQARGLDGQTPPDQHVEEMAERYLPLIQQIQPKGPYYLAGFSFGCHICYELTLRLEQMGEQVAFLGLIDEVAPVEGFRPRMIHLLRLMFGRAGRTFLHHLHDYLYLAGNSNDSSESQRASLRKQLQQLDWSSGWRSLLQHSAMAALLPPESHALALQQPAMRPMFDLFILHCRESFRYTPSPNPRPAFLFKSDWWNRHRWLDPTTRDPSLGWSHLLGNQLEIYQASGDHLGILRQPHVKLLAQQLQEAMQKARLNHPVHIDHCA